MHSLPLFLKLRGIPAILVGSGPAFEARRRLLDRAGAIIAGEAADARIGFVAFEDAALAKAAAKRLRGRGLLTNVADQPELCDFTLPAIVDRDPVVIAIGTGGASAGLSAELRQRLEAQLPASLGGLAHALQVARARMRAVWPDSALRRQALGQALSAGGAVDALIAAPPDVEAWLEKAEEPNAGRVETINLVSADPDDLTLRQARLLASADLLVHVPDAPEQVLARGRADALRTEANDPPPAPAEGLTVFVRWA